MKSTSPTLARRSRWGCRWPGAQYRPPGSPRRIGVIQLWTYGAQRKSQTLIHEHVSILAYAETRPPRAAAIGPATQQAPGRGRLPIRQEWYGAGLHIGTTPDRDEEVLARDAPSSDNSRSPSLSCNSRSGFDLRTESHPFSPGERRPSKRHRFR